jgi:hypothetical protein
MLSSGAYAWTGNSPPVTPTEITGIVNSFGVQVSGNNGVSYSTDNLVSSFQINDTEVTPVPFEFSPVGDIAILGGLWLGSKILKKKSK